MLEAAGISAFDESVLRALFGADGHTAASLAAALDAPPQAVGDALGRLVELGLAAHDGAAVVAVDPRVALTAVVRERRTELDRLALAVDELSTSFHTRTPGASASRLIEVIEGRAAIGARFQDVIVRAEHEVLAFDTPPYAVHDYGDDEVEIGLLARQVACRAVYAAEVLDHPVRAERIRALVHLGEQARVIPRLATKMIIADRREAMLPFQAPEEQGEVTRCAVVHGSALCDALVTLFESVWAQSAPLFTGRSEREDGDDGLESADAAILRYLNAGMTDDQIARQLGLGQRTVRRHVAELAARLGAGSRFQIGAQAARRGWV